MSAPAGLMSSLKAFNYLHNVFYHHVKGKKLNANIFSTETGSIIFRLCLFKRMKIKNEAKLFSVSRELFIFVLQISKLNLDIYLKDLMFPLAF